jgi:hypothetical protein
MPVYKLPCLITPSSRLPGLLGPDWWDRVARMLTRQAEEALTAVTADNWVTCFRWDIEGGGEVVSYMDHKNCTATVGTGEDFPYNPAEVAASF